MAKYFMGSKTKKPGKRPDPRPPGDMADPRQRMAVMAKMRPKGRVQAR